MDDVSVEANTASSAAPSIEGVDGMSACGKIQNFNTGDTMNCPIDKGILYNFETSIPITKKYEVIVAFAVYHFLK